MIYIYVSLLITIVSVLLQSMAYTTDLTESWTTHNNPCETCPPKIYPDFMYHQCIQESLDHSTCNISSTFGMQNISHSDILHIKFHQHFSADGILQHKDFRDSMEDNNPTMLIRIAITDIVWSMLDEVAIGRDIDRFLITRPWWKVSGYPLYDTAYHRNLSEYHITLERYPHSWRPYLDYLVKTQYLSAEQCEVTPMIVGRQPGHHPGVSACLNMFSTVKKDFPYAVFVAYWHSWNAFVSLSDCPNTQNKYECGFLPMTNCSIPNFILQCKNQTCLETRTRGLITGLLFPNHSYEHIYLLDIRKHGYLYGKDLSVYPFSTFSINDSQILSMKFMFIRAYDSPSSIVDMTEIPVHTFSHFFQLRYNAFYRPRINRLIQELYTSNSSNMSYAFTPTTPCVAVHIRRGDRIKTGIDFIEWCGNLTHDRKIKGNDTLKRGCVDLDYPTILKPCPHPDRVWDLQCATVPFEAIRLHHILNKIPKVINPVIYDVLLFSDDPIFLQEQIKTTMMMNTQDNRWRFHTLRPPELPSHLNMTKYHSDWNVYSKASRHYRHEAGTASGVLFQSSIRVAKQCSAFIGHFASQVSRLIYNGMCIEHGGRYGVCPPYYDFERGL